MKKPDTPQQRYERQNDLVMLPVKVPRSELDSFREACERRGTSMRERLRSFMRKESGGS